MVVALSEGVYAASVEASQPTPFASLAEHRAVLLRVRQYSPVSAISLNRLISLGSAKLPPLFFWAQKKQNRKGT